MANAALFLREDEIALLQLAQLMEHRDSSRVEFRGDLTHRAPRIRLDDVEDLPAGSTSQRVEHSSHIVHM